MRHTVRKILFDTGANGPLMLENMKKLGIDPAEIDDVFISHAHFDHVGGLSSFIEVNDKAMIHAPESFENVELAGKLSYISGPAEIHENIFSTGELEGIEQSLVIKTNNGIVIVVGCSHPGVEKILKAASQFGKPYAIVGGLHGFNEFDLIKDLKLICPTHCTQFKSEIKARYPDKYVEGGAGKVIEL